MYLHRPEIRPIGMFAAFLLAWPLTGIVSQIPDVARVVIAGEGTIGEGLGFLLVCAIVFVTGESIPHMGGPPPDRYLMVLPVMAVLMIFATGIIRRGRRPAPGTTQQHDLRRVAPPAA